MKVYVANGDGTLEEVCTAVNEGTAQMLAQGWKIYYPSDRVFFGNDESSAREVVIRDMANGLKLPYPIDIDEKKRFSN